MAATALDLVEAYCPRECSRGNLEGPSGGDNALTTKENPPTPGEEPASQWFLVDELDSGLSGGDQGRTVEWMGCAKGESEQAHGVGGHTVVKVVQCGFCSPRTLAWEKTSNGCTIVLIDQIVVAKSVHFLGKDPSLAISSAGLFPKSLIGFFHICVPDVPQQ